MRTRNPETTVAAILTIHMSIVYSLIGVTELVDESTEVVGLAGSPPAEDGCVQMLSSVTEDKLSEVCNSVNIIMQVPGVCECIPTCAKHFNLVQVQTSSWCHVDPEVLPRGKCCEVHHS